MKADEIKNAETIVNSGDISAFVLKTLSTTDDLQSFLKKVYERFGFAIIVTDMAYRLIAYSGPLPCPDPLWQALIEKGAAAPETVINEYFDDGFTDAMIASDGPVDVSWGVNAAHPQCTCTVKLGNVAEGCCSLLYLDKGKLDFALRLDAALADAAAVYLSGMKTKGVSHNHRERAAIARFLLENVDTPVSLLYGTKLFRTEKIDPNFMVVIISAQRSNNARLQNIVTWLKEKHPNMLYLNKGDDVQLFFWGVWSDSHRKQILDDITNEARGKLPVICGASSLFIDADMRKSYIEQAQLALAFGKKCGECGVYSYFDCYTDIMLRLGYANTAETNCILPEIAALIKYDEDNNTTFFETLSVYLDEYCDITAAANKLYIHRNSMLYRIKKCEDIMGVDLKDNKVRRRLSLCTFIMEMRKADNE